MFEIDRLCLDDLPGFENVRRLRAPVAAPRRDAVVTRTDPLETESHVKGLRRHGTMGFQPVYETTRADLLIDPEVTAGNAPSSRLRPRQYQRPGTGAVPSSRRWGRGGMGKGSID